MPNTPIVQFFLVLGISTCLLAFWKGGRAERIAAGLILGNIVLTVVGDSLFSRTYQPIIQQSSDGITALVLLVLTVSYGSLWLGGAMLLYAAQFTLHSYYLVTGRPTDNFHAAMNNLDFLGVLLCLGIGAAASWRRRARVATSRIEALAA